MRFGDGNENALHFPKAPVRLFGLFCLGPIVSFDFKERFSPIL